MTVRLEKTDVVIVGLGGYFAARHAAGVPSGSVLADSGVGALVRSYAFLIATYPILVVAPVAEPVIFTCVGRPRHQGVV